MNGKKIALIGFGCNLAIIIIYLLMVFAYSFFSTGIGGQLDEIFIIVRLASIAVAAFGFLLIWNESREFLDFIMCGSLVLNVIMLFFRYKIVYHYRPEIIGAILVLAYVYYLVFAIRAKKINILFTFLFLCAFIFTVFQSKFADIAYGIGLPYFLVWGLMEVGFIICDGLCFIEVKNE